MTDEQAATQIYGGKPMTGDWKPDERTAEQERALVMAMVKQWMKHEKDCGNMKGAMLLINLSHSIERGDHIKGE